ncbi:hypothetical protein PpBr36_00576 [Pyricularia pennisetigena]|uniref:hypothetical protein n=1 Tax=Pyricularia pennisetigena TaxID=1578925 RepID=UPI00114E1CD4|nr:hypothetical protein PpBr36_00576 [Pyricularia pennisetigena]TLS27832.1 hypothetical protein PpBr36_00576 [Pyricularia pennisetigena]
MKHTENKPSAVAVYPHAAQHSIETARVQAASADRVLLRNPCQEALETQAISSVRRCAILPLVKVPIVRRRVDTLSLERRHQILVALHPHRTTHDFTNTGHEHVDTLGHPEVVGVFLHVEGLDLDGEVREEYRPVDDVGHPAFGSLGDIVAKHVRVTLLVEDRRILGVEPINGIAVLHPHEGSGGLDEVRVESLDVACNLGVVENAVDNTANDLLDVDKKVLKVDTVQLTLHVRGLVTTENQVPVVKHVRLPNILRPRDLVGNGISVTGCATRDFVIVDLQLAAVGRVLAVQNLAELAIDEEGCALSEQQSLVRLGEVARKNALQLIRAALERQEGGVLLDTQVVDAAKHFDPRALVVTLTQLHVLLPQLDPGRRRKRGILDDLNVLGVLEVLEALLAQLLLGGGGLICLEQLLLVCVQHRLGLLDGTLGRLLPDQAGRGLFVRTQGARRRGPDLVRLSGETMVADVGVAKGLIGLLLGAVSLVSVNAHISVDVDLVFGLGPIGELLQCSHCDGAGNEGFWLQ